MSAVEALTGVKIGTGRPPQYDLETFFRAFCTRSGDSEVRVRPANQGLRPFANMALTYLMSDKDPSSSGDDNPFDDPSGQSRLVNHGTRLKRATNNDKAAMARIVDKESEYTSYIISVQSGQNLEEEETMLCDLREIEQVLSRWGIAISIDPIDLGLASLWDETA